MAGLDDSAGHRQRGHAPADARAGPGGEHPAGRPEPPGRGRGLSATGGRVRPDPGAGGRAGGQEPRRRDQHDAPAARCRPRSSKPWPTARSARGTPAPCWPCPRPKPRLAALKTVVASRLSTCARPRSWSAACTAEPPPPKPRQAVDRPNSQALEEEFRETLGTKVNLHRNRKGQGRLVIHFYSEEELQAIYDAIVGGVARHPRTARRQRSPDAALTAAPVGCLAPTADGAMMATYLGLALLSAAALAFEITLTRLFSVTQWYHFAFLAVSVALLGYGASGTALSLVPRWAEPPTARRSAQPGHPLCRRRRRRLPQPEPPALRFLSHRLGADPAPLPGPLLPGPDRALLLRRAGHRPAAGRPSRTGLPPLRRQPLRLGLGWHRCRSWPCPWSARAPSWSSLPWACSPLPFASKPASAPPKPRTQSRHADPRPRRPRLLICCEPLLLVPGLCFSPRPSTSASRPTKDSARSSASPIVRSSGSAGMPSPGSTASPARPSAPRQG